MTGRDDDFRARPGRIRSQGGRPDRFISKVLKAAARSGGVTPGGAGGRRGAAAGRSRSTFGRGRLAFSRTRLMNPQRRVVVKARIIRQRGASARTAPLAAHIAYLRREGVTRDGAEPHLFGADGDRADGASFAERCKDDRHYFRFIVSPEDAGEMTDLRAFTRDLVARMEDDLGTRLDWTAIDHWNTDNPHVHLLVRGVAEDGSDLVIARDYIGRDMRTRAEDLVSIELGPRPEHQIRSSLDREVDAERWTRLDFEIRVNADATGFVDLRPETPEGSDPHIRRLMVGRLQRLERMGLATSAGPAQWLVGPEAERTLRDLGTRGDIIKTMHRALSAHGHDRPLDDYVIDAGAATGPIVGRLVDKGLHDELAGTAYAVIDGTDGRVHHVRFRDIGALADSPAPGGLVEVRRFGRPDDPSPTLTLATRSDLPIVRQITAPGATWLDHRLVARADTPLAHGGFGAEARTALEARTEHLIDRGLAQRQGQRVIFARNLLDTLRRRELDDAAARIADQTGMTHRPVAGGDAVAGRFEQRVTLSSGRFAMIGDGLGFSLVPWSPSLERQLGQHVSGVTRDNGGIDWSLRQRGLGR